MLPFDMFPMLADCLYLKDLLCMSAACNSIRGTTIAIADLWVASKLHDLECIVDVHQPGRKRIDNNKKLHRLRLWISLQPYPLIFGGITLAQTRTIPFRFTIDTQGPLFLEVRMVVAKALNGSPKIGFVNAEASHLLESGWLGDLSRGQAIAAQCYAMAFSPSWGKVWATPTAMRDPALQSQVTRQTFFSGITQKQEFYTGWLNWSTSGDCRMKWNAPIRAGIFFKNGSFSFWRESPCGTGKWHSSGIVSTSLPQRVLPCVFMSSFAGYADVTFASVWRSPPDVCAECDARGHGLWDGWNHVISQA
jgi:hypothetical protein